MKTLRRDFRIYWSHDHKGIAKKESTWREFRSNVKRCQKMTCQVHAIAVDEICRI